MEQVIANIYAACLSAEMEPHGELVDLTINAVQDGLAGPNKDETLGAIFSAVEELTQERQQKGALFRIKLTAIAAAAKALPQNTREALLKSLKAMGEVARQHSLSATSNTVTLLVDSVSKVETAVAQPTPPPAPPRPEMKAEAPSQQAGLTLQGYLKQHARHAASDKIAFAPDIPLKKMSGTLHSIGGYVKAEDVVVVIDDTVFGGSKEGVFITHDRIFVKEAFTDLAIYRLDTIQHIGAEGRRIFINRRQIVGLTQPDKGDLELLFSAINEFLAPSRPQPASAPAQGSRATPAPFYTPPPQSSFDDEEGDEEEEGDSLHGFFYFRAAEIHLEQEPDSYHERMLMVDMINTSMGLYQYLANNEVDVSEQSKWVATTDVLHFESLIYVVELCQHLLTRKIGLKESVMTEFRNMFFTRLLYPYMVASGEFDALNQEAGVRAGLYRIMMDSNPNELPKILHISLPRPAVVKVCMTEEQQEYMREVLSEFEEECWNFIVASAYMRHLSERVEDALVRFTNGMRNAR